MSFASNELRRLAWICWGLLAVPGVAAAETKQPVGAVTNPPVDAFNPWGSEPAPSFNPWEGGVGTEQLARGDSPCGNCDTDWCNVNYGRGYEGLPLPAWTDLPPWYAGADALFLVRDNSEDITIASIGPQGAEALTTEDFDYELRPGLRLTLGRTINDNFRIEASYLGQHSWDDTVTVRNLNANALGGLGNLFSPFSGFGNPVGVPGLDFNNRVTIDETSELDSAEIDLRYRAPVRCGAFETILLCGVRYVRVDESFGYFSQSSVTAPIASTNLINVETSNDLVGGQIGGNVIYRASERWWINTDAKAGVFGNAARQNTVYTRADAQGGSSTITGEAQEGGTALVGEVKIESCYQLFPRLTIVAGYQAMWIDGLALGTNNLQRDFNILTLGPAEVDHNGTSVYHGPHAGVVWSW